MDKKSNWQEFKDVLELHGIKKLYHFTDRDNLDSIIANGGLYSWADCENKGIDIAKPGGSQQSRNLDCRDGLQNYVRVCFTRQHPMMFVAMNDHRISNPVILEIDLDVVSWKGTMFADRNATKTGAKIGRDLNALKRIHFQSVKADKHFDLDVDEQPFFQAEILVTNFIPLQYITNISDFGIPIPSQTHKTKSNKSKAKTNYPSISNYVDFFKNAEYNFATLTDIHPVFDDNNNPIFCEGDNSVVFKMKDIKTGKLYAVKCFTREQEGRGEAYRKIADYLADIDAPYILPIKYLENELFVDTNQSQKTEFPVLLMDWSEGTPLDKYVQDNIDDPHALSLLMSQFCRFSVWLSEQQFAHGDLKPDNILVSTDCSIVAVDYDGMFVPSMKGEKARELGSPDYRHPLYKDIAFGKHIDDFPIALLVFTLGLLQGRTSYFKTIYKNFGCLLQEPDIKDFKSSHLYAEACKFLKYPDFSRIFSLFDLLLNDKTAPTVTLVEQLKSIQRDADNISLFFHAEKLCDEGKGSTSNLITAYSIFKLLKESSHIEGAICHACCLKNGYGCNKQTIKGLILEKELAEQGYARAQCNLGVSYWHGKGVKRDFAKAVEWLTKAAEQGDAKSQYILGFCHEIGICVIRDLEKAVEWFSKAAEQRHPKAQYNLGVCHLKGYGVKQDFVKAFEWFTKAAEQGDSLAQYNLGVCYKEGTGVKQDFVKAVKWFTTAAGQGHSTAQYNLGCCYYKGEGIKQNFEKAVEWFSKAAEQRHPKAQYNLGVCHLKGYGVKQDFVKAFEWFTKAAEQGDSLAQYNLGVCYKEGTGVKQDYEKAIEWYSKAAEQGNEKAINNLNKLL